MLKQYWEWFNLLERAFSGGRAGAAWPPVGSLLAAAATSLPDGLFVIWGGCNPPARAFSLLHRSNQQ